jgi:glycosyltransferase involved in cell wall biosynthesis
MVVKNQAEALPACLKSVGEIADEIIVVDIGSADKTKQTAERCGAKVFDYIWNNRYADARNFSFSKAAMNYIFWLNADEALSPESAQKLLCLKNQLPPNSDVVYMKNDARGSYEPRLLKRAHQYAWYYPPDETLYIWGDVRYCDIAVYESSTCVQKLPIITQTSASSKAENPCVTPISKRNDNPPNTPSLNKTTAAPHKSPITP